MFKKLTGKNWESWKEVNIDFTSGINVIIPLDESNPNDVGKTGLLRLLYWITENKPSGAQFYSDLAGKKGVTEGCLVLNNNKIIKQEKKIRINKKNEKVVVPDTSKYWIIDSKSEKDFGAYGQDVPDEIKRELNLSELNFQKQDDPLFIINDSGGQIAKTINRITKQDDVDVWIKELTTDVNSKNKEINILKEDIIEVDSKLEKLEKLENLESKISRYSELEENEQTLENKYNKVYDLKNKLEQVKLEQQEKEKEINKLEKLINEVKDLFIQLEEIETQEQEINNNISIIEGYIEMQEEKEVLMEAVSTEEDLKRLESLYLKENELQEQVDLINTYIGIHQDVKSLISTSNASKKRYIEVLKAEKICPTCLTDINDECIEKIIKEL